MKRLCISVSDEEYELLVAERKAIFSETDQIVSLAEIIRNIIKNTYGSPDKEPN